MKTTFPKEFSFIDFYRLEDTTDNSTILAVIFNNKEEASNWEHLLVNEPYSFLYQVVKDSPSRFVFKFTNYEFDYIFQVPKHVDESLLNFHLPFQILVCMVQQDKSLKPFGDFHRINPIPLN